MKKCILLLVVAMGLFVFSCEKDDYNARGEVPQEVIDQLYGMGFNPDGIEKVDEGYRIERDIIITEDLLASQPKDVRVPNAEQYRTTNVVSTGGSRNITVYMEVEGTDGGGGGGGNGNGNGNGNGGGKKNTSNAAFPSTYDLALDEAIARFNAENLDLTFSRTTSQSGADIVVSRLNKRDERRGVLGSAGFPSASGDPYGTINMSGVLESSYGLSTNGIATIIAHEMGHCIGFRHTDYFDRSISCGGATSNEGQAGVGAIHIPGTTTGADLQGNGSWMLSCTDGSNRDFTNDDKTALGWMYNGNY
jgi:hypothetical protein